MMGKLAGLVLIFWASVSPAWELGVRDTVAWTCPPGRESESNGLAQTALFLADTLSQMAGRPVSCLATSGPAASGIQLAVDPAAGAPTADEVFSGRLEAYGIDAAGPALRITAPTAVGVRHGVMDFLHRQGCRWLLPSPKWWIIPKVGRIAFEGRVDGLPSFAYRRIWYAYGAASPELTRHSQVWSDANRLGGAAVFQTGHSYGNIIDRNKAEFSAHPEYHALRQPPAAEPPAAARADPPEEAMAGEEVRPPLPAAPAPLSQNRDMLRFCFSNPGLRALCLRDRTDLLRTQRAANPLAFMVSMDPADGQGTCECEACRKLGSTTDRVVSLANHVARGLREAVPGGWVGMYAYSSHREPPGIAVESNIHVQVAMAFNKTGHTYEELIRLWGEKAGSLGIREYYGVEAWDFGMPGRIRGANPEYHRKRIPLYRASGAVSVSAESNDNWGPQALGFYVAAQLLWDARTDVDATVADFLKSAFGPAARPMGELYTSFATSPRLSPGNLARMYDLAFEALAAAPEPAMRARIVDVIAYLNYVDLFVRFERCAADTQPYYAALDAVMNYSHRIQSRGMVAGYALARRLCNANVKGKRDEFWLFGDSVIWKRGEPLTDDEVLGLASASRASLKAAAAARLEFSRNLIPRAALPAGNLPALNRTVSFRYGAIAYVMPREPGSFQFDFGPAVSAQLETAADGLRVAAFVPTPAATGTQAVVSLATGTLYRLVLRTGGATSTVTFPGSLAAAFEASPDQPLWLDSGVLFYVYVPAGTTELRCSGNPRLSLLDPVRKRTDLSAADQAGGDFARLPVGPSQAGRLWTIGNQTRGEIAFFNVPPLAQLDPDCPLLPAELFEKEGKTP